MTLEQFYKTGVCCCTGKPLRTSTNMNFVDTKIPVPWKFPSCGNVITGESGHGVAYVHDDAIDEMGKMLPLKHIVEFRGEKVIYHPIEEFKK